MSGLFDDLKNGSNEVASEKKSTGAFGDLPRTEIGLTGTLKEGVKSTFRSVGDSATVVDETVKPDDLRFSLQRQSEHLVDRGALGAVGKLGVLEKAC